MKKEKSAKKGGDPFCRKPTLTFAVFRVVPQSLIFCDFEFSGVSGSVGPVALRKPKGPSRTKLGTGSTFFTGRAFRYGGSKTLRKVLEVLVFQRKKGRKRYRWQNTTTIAKTATDSSAVVFLVGKGVF